MSNNHQVDSGMAEMYTENHQQIKCNALIYDANVLIRIEIRGNVLVFLYKYLDTIEKRKSQYSFHFFSFFRVFLHNPRMN